MKFVKSSCFVLAMSGVALSAPTMHDGDYGVGPAGTLESRSASDAYTALTTLESRGTCRKIGRVILKIGTSTAINALINEGADFAKEICEDQNAPNCVKYIRYIQRGINLAFIAAGFAHGAIGESNNNEQQSMNPGTTRRTATVEPTLSETLSRVLQDSGYDYESIEDVDVLGLQLSKRHSEPALKTRAIIKSMKHDDLQHDIAFNYYDNGGLVLHLAGDSQTLSTGADASSVNGTDLEKRFNGEGFKISLTTRKRSLLTRAHQNEMSNYIAADWAVAAKRDHLGDYMGLVKTDHTANFYFRIIPEIKGFGLNYESVDICGGMAGFL